MAKGDTPTQALAKVERQIYEAIGVMATQLHYDLQTVAPVDTGQFKINWTVYQIKDGVWRIHNNVLYASILWRGRDVFDGNGYETGSKYWPNGGDPMLAKADIELTRQLELIRE